MKGVDHEEVVACADYRGPRGRRGAGRARGGLGGCVSILLLGAAAADGDEAEGRIGLRMGVNLSVLVVTNLWRGTEGKGASNGGRRTPELNSRDVPKTQMTTRAAPASTTSLKPRVRATLRPYSSTPTMLCCVWSYHVVLGWVQTRNHESGSWNTLLGSAAK